MALIYNINESLDSNFLNDNDNDIKYMKLSESEFKKNIIGAKSLDLGIQHIATNPKINLDANLTNENKKKSFKLSLSEPESEKLDKIIISDAEFLASKNINGYHYIVFERIVESIN